MTKQKITFRLQRFKAGDAAPHEANYEVECEAQTTVLVALQEIRRTQDPSLMLRHSCHHGSCGTCAMRINGKEELSCVVKVLDLPTSTVSVEPLNNLPVISDLVVDMNPLMDHYTTPQMPYLRVSEVQPTATRPEGIFDFTRFENCIECGICVSACPVAGSNPEYYGPAALAAAWRVVEEPRTSEPEAALDWADHENGCWRCHVAYECSQVCPTKVDPAGSIMKLRGELTRRQFRRFFGFKSERTSK